MFSRLFGKGRPNTDDYGQYLSMIADFLCAVDSVKGQDKELQRQLVDHFNALMVSRIAIGKSAIGDKRGLVALSIIHIALMDIVDSELGYPTHKTPYDFVNGLAESIREMPAHPHQE